MNQQGRREGTSNVAFGVLLIKSEIYFINLFIFNCLTSKINLFNFNCSTSNFCFLNNIFFKRTDVYRRASLVSGVQLNRENDDLLSSRQIKFWGTLCTNILECEFPTKNIELTRVEFFEGPRVLGFEALGSDHFGRFGTKICGKQLRLWSENFYCDWLRWWNFAIKIALSAGVSSYLLPMGRHGRVEWYSYCD